MSAAHGEEGVPPTTALLFVITCFFIGICTKFFLSWVKVPYTAVLLVWGLCIGFLQAIPPSTLAFTETLSQWMSIDPHLLLLIFLPAIGFSAGINQEPHLLRKNWGQILILAWPGVVIVFLLIAVCARYFFTYGWTWPMCLLFGAMLSATDPVAVVAVLHEVGADEKLGSVIDGESLVNDGSALVIFLVLQRFVQGDSLTPGQIAALFCQLALLGAVVGAAFGAVTSVWLSRIWRDPGLDIVLTFTSAYACYFVAEELLGASGLLAVVVNGFTMSLIGGRQITHRFKVQMHAFWEALEWMANTILFLWVGIAFAMTLKAPGHPVLASNWHPSQHLQGRDWGYAVVLYLWLLVARASAIFFFLPLLSTGRIGYKLGWRQALVMVWAGLRGAVGVAMSLFIILDEKILDEPYKARCLFFMTLMAFTTVLINGSTTKFVLQGLGLLTKSPQQVQVLSHVLQELEELKEERLHQKPTSDPVLGTPDPDLVAQLARVAHRVETPNLKPSKLDLLLAGKGGARTVAGGGDKSSGSLKAVGGEDGEEGKREALVEEYRRRLLMVNKSCYGAAYEQLYLNTRLASILHEATDSALDVVGQGSLQDWALLKTAACRVPWRVRLLLHVAKLPLVGETVSQQAEGEVADRLRLVSTFIQAHRTAQAVLKEHLQDVVVPELEQSPGAALAHQAAQVVIAESEAEVQEALTYAQEELVKLHPDLPRLVSSWEAAVSLLHEQEALLGRVEAAGLLGGEEVHGLGHALSDRLQQLMQTSILTLAKRAAAAGPATAAAVGEAGGRSHRMYSFRRTRTPGPGSLATLGLREAASEAATMRSAPSRAGRWHSRLS